MTSDGELRVLDRWAGGVSWAVAGDSLHRTSHALAVGGSAGDVGADESPEPADDADVWLVDPVDAAGLDDLLADYGTVEGVVLLLDRHHRDTAALARRHDVAVHLPPVLAGEADEVDWETETFAGELDVTGYHQVTVVDNRLWHEAALYAPDLGTLVVPEAVGTAPLFVTGDDPLGVHPGLRLFPPRRALGDYEPDRVLVGHGAGVFDDAGAALRRALRDSRRTAPRLYGQILTMPFR